MQSVQFSNIFVMVYLAGTALHLCLNWWLEYISWRNRQLHGTEIPQELAGFVDEQLLIKTCGYKNARYAVWKPQFVLGVILDAGLLLSGVYPRLFLFITGLCPSLYVAMLLFFAVESLPGALLSLPFDLYEEFGIEKRFGFSTMTLKLWIIDELKGLVVSAVLGIPLGALMIWLILHAAGWWWLLIGTVFMAFSLIMSVVYPLWIAPLFNKFSALEEGELKERLSLLLDKAGFAAKGVYVMDASKRSRHSNAYFTGFGKSKRIVLYDTLVSQLTPSEIEAVLAHELGHYKHHHIIKRMCVMIPLVFASLFIAWCIVKLPLLYTGFGFVPAVQNGSVIPYWQAMGLFLESSVFSGYSVLTGVVGNYFSRRDEFQADAYAVRLCGGAEPLVTGLIKLNTENLSEITPPAVYCLFHYNHPPLLERIRAARAAADTTSHVR